MSMFFGGSKYQTSACVGGMVGQEKVIGLEAIEHKSLGG